MGVDHVGTGRSQKFCRCDRSGCAGPCGTCERCCEAVAPGCRSSRLLGPKLADARSLALSVRNIDAFEAVKSDTPIIIPMITRVTPKKFPTGSFSTSSRRVEDQVCAHYGHGRQRGFDIGKGNAAGAVDQEAVPGVTNSTANRCLPIVLD